MPTCVADRTVEAVRGREDLEVRALLRAAGAGLGTVREPVLYRPPVSQASGSSRWVGLVVALLALPALALPLRLSLASAEPAGEDGIWDAAGFVESDAPRSAGRFLVATVRKTSGTKQNSAAAMVRSQRNAIVAALACTGKHSAAEIRVRRRGVSGPSAGLIFGLSVIDHLVDADLTNGRHIAGTGKLSPGGRVGAVGAVGEKAAAAQRARADLFFVPIAQRAEAKRAAPNVDVVGVRSLDDAVRMLNGAGCRG